MISGSFVRPQDTTHELLRPCTKTVMRNCIALTEWADAIAQLLFPTQGTGLGEPR